MEQLLSLFKHLILSDKITVIRVQLVILGLLGSIVGDEFLEPPLGLPILPLIVTHPVLHHHIAANHILPASAVSAG